MKYGLTTEQLDKIISFIRTYPEIEEAVLFGSRAMGNYKKTSDVDIALKGPFVTASLAARMKSNLEEESNLPYFFDFLAYPIISNEALKQHIITHGIVLYTIKQAK